VEAEVKAEEQAAPAPAAEAAAPATEAPAADTAATAPAASETPATAPAETAVPAAEPVKPVLVSAVDFEDGRIYVAGTGEPARSVNVYIDDALTGSTIVGPDGAFLLEAPFDLKPGEHKIRADLLSADGTQVAARAEVPLVHEALVEVAAVETKPAEAAAEPASEAAATAAEAPAAVEAAPAAPAQAAQTETAAAEVTAKAEVPMTAEVPAAPAPSAAETNTAATPAPETVETPAVAAEAPAASTETAAASEAPAATVEAPATEPAAAPQADVQVEPIKTGASVIIRRGDNLWRISRRMLGKGVRYTTIYEANRNQIKNPSLIYPGQVLDVPGATSVN
ncbi:MAG TPA: LysM peptidoglycan-binding domain-containing protein, partial [Rhizobiaceae bacterium]|nr:LysM peptidoglycan-binding domain-containing protein [Rhizobiaceae bacterium]